MNTNQSKTILLVDDEAIILAAEKLDLEDYGYQVIEAYSGEESIELFKSNPEIDMVIMDIDLGNGMDGPEAAKIILKERSIPLLFMSSHTEPEIVGKTERITSYGYVVKNSGITVIDASIKMAFKLFDAHEKLQNSKDKIKKTQKIANMGFWELDLQSNELTWSENVYDIFEISPENCKLTGESFINFLHPDDIGKTEKTFQESLKKKIPYNMDHRIVLKNNKIKYLHEHCKTIYDNNGKPIKSLGMVQDITRRKLDEIKLLESEKKYKSLFESANYAIFLADAKSGLIIDANSKAEKLIGYSKDKIIGMHQTELHPKKLQKSAKACFRDDLDRKDQTITKNFEVIHKDGHVIPVEINPSVIDINEKPCILGIFRDVSERKQAEEALINSEKHYRQLFNLLPYGGEILDTTGKIMDCSESTLDMLGYKKDELIGKPITDFIDPNSKQFFKDNFQKIVRGKALFPEITMLHKNGHKVNILRAAQPILNSNGEVEKILALNVDITERKKIKKQLIFEKEKLENIFNSIEDGITIIDQQFNVQYVNLKLLKDFGEYKGQKCYEYFHDRKNICPWCKNEKVFNGEKVHWEFYSFKNRKSYDIIDTPLKNPDGSISKLEILRDITDIKQANKIIEKTQILNNTLLNSMPYPIMMINKKRKVVAANKIALDMGVIINDYCWKGFGKCDFLTPAYEKLIKEGKSDTPGIQCNFCRVDEMFKKIEYTNDPCVKAFGRLWDTYWYPIDENTYLHYAIDITDRKKAEEKINNLLKEKEILLEEVHHRIKNNMSVMISLLSLQLREAKNPEVISVFLDAKSRLESMTVLYEKLYTSKNYLDVSINEYFTKLTGEIIQTFPNHHFVKIESKIDNFQIKTKVVFSLGIILNELLTNTMKYAFPKKKGAKIRINISKRKNHVMFIYEDNGIGVADTNKNESKGFGLFLINMLVKQIRGEYKILSEKGTKFIIEFDIK